MQLPRQIRLRQTTTPEVDKGLQQVNEEVARVIDGNVSFGVAGVRDNIDGAWITVADTGGANTDFTVTHNLGRVPEGWLVIKQDKATSIYVGSVAWTETQITLKSSTANVALTLFII